MWIHDGDWRAYNITTTMNKSTENNHIVHVSKTQLTIVVGIQLMQCRRQRSKGMHGFTGFQADLLAGRHCGRDHPGQFHLPIKTAVLLVR